MSNDVAVFEKSNLPAHLAAMFPTTNDLSANVSAGGFAHLSIKGKVWTVARGKDDRQVIMNEDGDPRSSIEVVILKANPSISKVFYIGGYVEGSDDKPACYSNDGVAPAADAAEPQSKKCAICPHNQWGSKITENGSKLKACSDSRRLAVAPAGDLKDPMLLRVPAASLKPLAEYGEMFTRKGVPYQAAVTKMRFDPEMASPKLLFKFERWLDADDAATVREVMESPVVTNIIGDGLGAMPEQTSAPELPSPPKAVVKSVTKPAPKVEAEPVEEDEAPPVVKKAAPKAEAKAAKPPAIVEDDDLVAALDDVLGGLDDE